MEFFLGFEIFFNWPEKTLNIAVRMTFHEIFKLACVSTTPAALEPLTLP